MARVLRKTNQSVGDLALSINDLKAWVLDGFRKIKADISTGTGVGSTFLVQGFHNDRCERTITAANATDLATSLTLVNQIKAVYEFHRVDLLAHTASDTTNAIAAPLATDLATAQTLANELKTDYNAHRTQAGVHDNNDATNTITSANATDQGTLNTLLNELKTDINAHMASGPAGKSVRSVPA